MSLGFTKVSASTCPCPALHEAAQAYLLARSTHLCSPGPLPTGRAPLQTHGQSYTQSDGMRASLDLMREDDYGMGMVHEQFKAAKTW